MNVLPPAVRGSCALLTATDGEGLAALDPGAVLALYRQYGALLLRGFGADVAGLAGFARSFCSGSVFNESPDRQLLDAAANIQSVNGGELAFPLHPELSREPWKPDICFFACLQPPTRGGATTICDGVELVRQLLPPVRDELAGRRLRYIQPAPPEMLQYWLGTATPSDADRATPPSDCPYSFPKLGQHIVRSFSRPALHTPMFTTEPAFGNFLLFARYYVGRRDFPLFDDLSVVPDALVDAVRVVGDKLTIALEWQAGDLLMLDNTRFMHGRTAIHDPDERLIATYFGYLADAPPNPEEPADPPWRRSDFRPPSRRS